MFLRNAPSTLISRMARTIERNNTQEPLVRHEDSYLELVVLEEVRSMGTMR